VEALMSNPPDGPIVVRRTYTFTFESEEHRRQQLYPSLPDGERVLPNRTPIRIESDPPQPDAGRTCSLGERRPVDYPHDVPRQRIRELFDELEHDLQADSEAPAKLAELRKLVDP
jgi:hypothetical protein